ncbi:alpha-glycosidase [Paenibacillus sepulcri]|uniref:Alpha amylase N-terminal ig-like domain-containing protein n=1 Tax=Paenibacillus sepulcri TaxID=359917 RepID=A0ABS7C513_9BACL|nr:alpha amylase N-terminal ig-like domain-containing protein [Paenibacillus sepulcri]
MFRECFYHKPRSNWAYAYDKETIHLLVQTKKDDVDEVAAMTGDKYDWEHLQEDIPMEKVAADRFFDYWMAAVKPAFKRFSYGFRMRSGDELAYLTEAGVSSEPPAPTRGYYEYPYIHEVDLFSAPQWAKDAVFYQIMPDRFEKGKSGSRRERLADWGSEPTKENFFGGDLQGILGRLDHLSELGITAVYLTPIFESPSNHKYDIIDYRRIDPYFGDIQDLKQLVEACHERGIRVVLDAVFNHASEHFPPFRDVVEKGEQSRYKDWFHIRSFPLQVKDGRATYETFGFFEHMPKLNTANRDVKRYLLDVAEYWIRETDIDGWRLDVANEVDHHFWREFRQRVKAVKPDAYLIGEVWSDSMMWLLGDQFDSVMNYPFADTVMDFIAEENVDGLTFAERINALLIRYPQQTSEVIFNLLSSHDTSRVLTRVGENKERLKLAVVFLMTYIGTPCIFYGDEIGLKGGDDPDNRRCMIWGRQEQDRELFDFYKLLIDLRKAHTALRSGRFRFLKADSGDQRIIYERMDAGEHFTIWMNNTEERTVLEHHIPGGDWVDALSGEGVPLIDGMQKVELEPFGYRILSRSLQDILVKK